jgi:hypothetical protein
VIGEVATKGRAERRQYQTARDVVNVAVERLHHAEDEFGHLGGSRQ